MNVVPSLVNKSTVALGINGNFTGTYEDVSNYSEVWVMLRTDRSSQANAVVFQWSNDGVNQLDVDEFTYVAPTPGSVVDGPCFRLPVRGKYFRINYTNAGTAQGSLDLQTFYLDGNNEQVTNIPHLGFVECNGKLMPLRYSVINVTNAAAGSTNVVPGVANRKIRLMSIHFCVSAAISVTLEDSAANIITGAMPFASNGQWHDDRNPPCFIGDCGFGNGFNIRTSAAGNVRGYLLYIQEPGYRLMGGADG